MSWLVKIKVFDDGNGKYQQYPNAWAITETRGPKVELTNISHPHIKIGSISKWKTQNLGDAIRILGDNNSLVP